MFWGVSLNRWLCLWWVLVPPDWCVPLHPTQAPHSLSSTWSAPWGPPGSTRPGAHPPACGTSGARLTGPSLGSPAPTQQGGWSVGSEVCCGLPRALLILSLTLTSTVFSSGVKLPLQRRRPASPTISFPEIPAPREETTGPVPPCEQSQRQPRSSRPAHTCLLPREPRAARGSPAGAWLRGCRDGKGLPRPRPWSGLEQRRPVAGTSPPLRLASVRAVFISRTDGACSP